MCFSGNRHGFFALQHFLKTPLTKEPMQPLRLFSYYLQCNTSLFAMYIAFLLVYNEIDPTTRHKEALPCN